MSELHIDELEKITVPDLTVNFDILKENAKGLSLQKVEIEFIIRCIDLTTLAGDDTKQKVRELLFDAIHPIPNNSDVKCASICIYPARILDAKNSMDRISLPISSVAAGFPSGQYHLQTRLLEIELAVQDGANEIDAVISRTLALDGEWNELFNEIVKMKKACSDRKLKVILSTGELKTAENIYKASIVAMLAGADFIKTSTGKEAINATLDAAFYMCSAIKYYHLLTGRRVGFKAAGGIRQIHEALEYRLLVENILGSEWIEPKYFRIGASIGLLQNIRSNINSP